MRAIDEYRGIVGDKVISDIVKMAKNLYGLRVLHINSTYYGGGVAEMLYSRIPLMNDVGVIVNVRCDRVALNKIVQVGRSTDASDFTAARQFGGDRNRIVRFAAV